jgi:hypothetical protein
MLDESGDRFEARKRVESELSEEKFGGLEGENLFASSPETGPKKISVLGFSGPATRDDKILMADWPELAPPQQVTEAKAVHYFNAS